MKNIKNMKNIKSIKILVFVFSIIILMFSNISYANSNITLEYNGNNQSFKYVNTKNTDLLSDLKDLMPGDKREQIITIQSKNIKEETKMYLKMNNIGMNELLSNKISFRIYKGDSIIFDNAIHTASEQLINLHTFSKDDAFDMRVVIDVSEEVGNEVEDLTLSIEWKFMVEEAGEYIDVDLPQTSDNIMIYVWLAIFAILMLSLLKWRKWDNGDGGFCLKSETNGTYKKENWRLKNVRIYKR